MPFDGSISFLNDEYIALVQELEEKNIEEKRKILQQVIRAKTREQTSDLKREVASDGSKDLNTLKIKLENEMRKPLTPAKLGQFLKELPLENTDPIGRAFMVQYIVGKLRSDGFILLIKPRPEGIILETEKKSSKETAIILQETLESHAQSRYITRFDVEQALVIGSGALSQYRDTQAEAEMLDTRGYYDFLMKKYRFNQDIVTTSHIRLAKDIPEKEKAFLISYLSGGIQNTPLASTLEKYDTIRTQAKEVFDSKTFQTIEKSFGGTPADAKDLAKRVTEDPSILSGKPLTTIAAGIALVMGLGYEGKGK